MSTTPLNQKNFIYSGKNSPCPICGRTKDADCRWKQDEVYFCHSYIDQDAEIEAYVHRGATSDGLWGQYFPKMIDQQKPIRPKGTKEYFYPDRNGNPLIKVVRIDNGDGTKSFSQYHWEGKTWSKGLPDEVKQQVPIYRYQEVKEAIAQGKQIFVVEGEGCADHLWNLGIPATTMLGGSKKYRSYGNYFQDLKDAQLVLCPDRDQLGIEHMDEIAQDFSNARWAYVYPTSLLWERLPKNGGLDVSDWIADGANKEQVLAAISDKRKVVIESETKAQEPKQKTILDLLMAIASQAIYFHTENQVAYADIYVDRHRETHPVRSKVFRQWLGHQLYSQHGKVAGGETLNNALLTLEAIARFEGEEVSVHLRVAELDGKIYLDLGESNWKAIEISAGGWQILSDYPVRFRRLQHQLPLPIPIRSGKVLELKQILNFNDSDWVLVLCWLTFCFVPKYSHPVLIFQGQQGTGKSFASRILKNLVDPAKSLLQPEPKELRDLSISANNRWLLAFDNFSNINNWMSDALCRVATGGGFSTRTLHENDEETVFEFIRPIIINGIDSIATRSDLLERSILVTLPRIPEEKRLTEEEIQALQQAILPRVFGALLTAVSQALLSLPQVKPKRLPRMADFARWSIAIEEPLGFKAGDFLKAYEGNRQTAHETALEASPTAAAIQQLMESRDRWKGTASELLSELEKLVDEKIIKSRIWPGTPIALGKAIVRVAPDLRGVGIAVDSYKGANGRRLTYLEKIVVENATNATNAPSLTG